MYTQIIDLLDKIFTSNIPEDYIIKIDTLVLNIGYISLQSIDKEIFQKIQNKLPAIISNKIQIIKKKNIIPLKNAKLNAIQHYLQYGYFAWWMFRQTTSKSIELLYINLLTNYEDDIKKFWKEKSDHCVVERFVKQFSIVAIEKNHYAT